MTVRLSGAFLTIVVLAAAVCAAVQAATAAPERPGLSRQERQIVAAAHAQNAPAIELLEQLVDINSGTMNPAGVEHIARIMMSQFQTLGFKVRWVPMEAVGRAGNVVAEHAGSGHGKRILLIGHMDTVFEKDSPFQRYERHGDSAVGPGVNDMKDGLSIMVAALRSLDRAGALAEADIRIVLSGDEENAGRPISVSRADMIQAAEHSDVALEFEALAEQDGHDMGTISRRSSSTWTVHTWSRSGHSSDIFAPEVGFGAGFELARIVDAFRNELREPNATFSVGIMAVGADAAFNADQTGATVDGKANVIPAKGLARGDLRTLSNDQTERLTARMRDIVAHHLPGTDADIAFSEGYPSMPPTAGNRALLDLLNGINAALGLEPMGTLDPLRRGAGDISFVADKVDGLVGFGAVGHGSHAPGETVDLTSIDRQIVRTALLIERLSRTPRQPGK
jgi:glutamate carboxypeptidase